MTSKKKDVMSIPKVVKCKKKAKPKKPIPNKHVSKLTIAEGWRLTFIANAKDKAPDYELTIIMTRLFPASKGNTTMSRVSMMRCCYNKGSYIFKSLGEPKKLSYKYVDGVKRQPNKVPVKKKVVKKNTKK